MSFPVLDHEAWMLQALSLAQQAGMLGEIPVAAIILHHPPATPPAIIATGHNLRESLHDPSAHAEIVALRAAGQRLGHWRLVDCTLYVTLEPCPMCAGALVQARLAQLVYGAPDPKAGAVRSLYQLCSDPRLNHRVNIINGVLAADSATLLRQFFAARRSPPATAPSSEPPAND